MEKCTANVCNNYKQLQFSTSVALLILTARHSWRASAGGTLRRCSGPTTCAAAPAKHCLFSLVVKRWLVVGLSCHLSAYESSPLVLDATQAEIRCGTNYATSEYAVRPGGQRCPEGRCLMIWRRKYTPLSVFLSFHFEGLAKIVSIV